MLHAMKVFNKPAIFTASANFRVFKSQKMLQHLWPLNHGLEEQPFEQSRLSASVHSHFWFALAFR